MYSIQLDRTTLQICCVLFLLRGLCFVFITQIDYTFREELVYLSWWFLRLQ